MIVFSCWTFISMLKQKQPQERSESEAALGLIHCHTVFVETLSVGGGKCLIYLAGNSSIFKAISVSKMYLSSFEIIFKYVSATTRKCIHYMSAPCLFFQPHFHLSESETPLGRNRRFKNSYVQVVLFFFPVLIG